MNKQELLEKRKKAKAKKPDFIIQDAHKKNRIRPRWRKPRGWQSKMRLCKRGYNKLVSPGYGSPKEVYKLDPSGMQAVNIRSAADLESIDPKTQAAVISSTLGAKKRIDIMQRAKERGIKILNFKDPEKYVKDVEDKIRKNKEYKKEKEQKKEKEKAKKSRKEKEKEQGLKEKLSEEDKKEQDKKEKDKVLTQKGN